MADGSVVWWVLHIPQVSSILPHNDGLYQACARAMHFGHQIIPLAVCQYVCLTVQQRWSISVGWGVMLPERCNMSDEVKNYLNSSTTVHLIFWVSPPTPQEQLPLLTRAMGVNCHFFSTPDLYLSATAPAKHILWFSSTRKLLFKINLSWSL